MRYVYGYRPCSLKVSPKRTQLCHTREDNIPRFWTYSRVILSRGGDLKKTFLVLYLA